MRRAFFHVDEFGEDGMIYLPHLVCLSEPLVIWGPSALLLKATAKAFLTPRDLLTLIDQSNAPVRIIGREEWLLEKQFRDSHPWPLARWVDDFDAVVKRLALEDLSKPLSDRRVIIAESEKGLDKADAALASRNGQKIATQLRILYRKGLLPVGILDKARRARAQGKSVPRTILRDLFNHSRAIASAQAEVAVTPSEHMMALHQIVPDSLVPGVTDFELSGKGYASCSDLREAVQLLRNLKPVLSTSELRNFLRSGLKRDLYTLMYSPRSTSRLDAHLVQQVSEATATMPLLKQLFPPDDPIALTLTIGGLVLGTMSMLLTGKPEWELIPVAVEAAKGALRRYSLIPEAVQPGHKARALFYLALGTKRPTRRQIHHLLTRLEQVNSST